MREYFDKELTQLNDSLIEMGGLVEQAIKNTMKMIVDGEDLLDIAREHENRINEAEKSIQSRCLHLLLHQAPVAHDLRYVSAALKMITDLEKSVIRQLILLKCLFTSRTKSRCSILLTFWKWQTMPQKW